jgi:hypothetical protein
MVNSDSQAALKDRLSVINDEIRDREEERDHIAALLKLWSRRKGKRTSAPAKPSERQAHPEWAARPQGGTKQDKIVQEVKRILESLPTRSADFSDVFKMLPAGIVGEGNGAREYTRTSILRLGPVYGVSYAQGGRLTLPIAPSGTTGVVDPFESVTTNPFEVVASGESPFRLVVRDEHE